MWKDASKLPGKEPKDWKPNTKYLYSVATANGWSHQGVKDLIFFNFRAQSTKDLTWVQFNQVMEWLGDLHPNTVSTKHDEETGELPF